MMKIDHAERLVVDFLFGMLVKRKNRSPLLKRGESVRIFAQIYT